MSAIEAQVDAIMNGAELTDAGNAERFAARYGDVARYVPGWGWLAWTGSHWTRDELKIRDLMLRTARDIHKEAAASVNHNQQREIAKWARQSQQAQRLQSALWCAQPALATRTNEFDRHDFLLPVKSGTIDLTTGHLKSHDPEDMLTRLVDIRYDPGALAPTWHNFLATVLPDPDVRALVKRLAGYTLTGSTTEQILIFLFGNGRNGKSVFIETLAKVLGDYHTPTRIETLSIGQRGIPNDVAALAGARLVSVSETPEGARLNESLVKDLTGGDTISARFLRHEFFRFQPQFKLWIRGNHKPQIRGTDDGIWRRVMLIPFAVQIPPDRVDQHLMAKLQKELPGILTWAVQGCLEWQREGLRPPSAILAAVRAYRGEMDTLGDFIDECCIVADHLTAKSSHIYSAYKRWSEREGHKAMSATRFGLTLSERGFEKEKRGTITWFGIGISGGLEGLDTSPSSSYSRAHNGCNAEIVSKLSKCPKCAGEGCKWCQP
jgi:putative DNA primase/helicase